MQEIQCQPDWLKIFLDKVKKTHKFKPTYACHIHHLHLLGVHFFFLEKQFWEKSIFAGKKLLFPPTFFL